MYVPDGTALELLRRRAQAALDTWVAEWTAGHPLPAVLTVNTALDHEAWQGHTCQQLGAVDGDLWLRANVADRARLAQWIFGCDARFAPGEVLEEIVNMSMQARAEELHAALFGESSLPVAEIVTRLPAELFQFGSGAVEMVCSSCGLRAIVDAGGWRTLVSDF
jgi:hypothetical protein